MKRPLYIFMALVFILTLILPTPAWAAPAEKLLPTFTIIASAASKVVTIQTYNFPPARTFDVLMSEMGNRGVGGVKVASLKSGAGGSFMATFNIPPSLAGLYQIAIRVQSVDDSGYYAYNWFYNQTWWDPNVPSEPVTSKTPTFYISEIKPGVSVTVVTQNFPASKTFDALMGYMGTRGVGGVYAGTLSTGKGGTLSATFAIPPALVGEYQIAVRLQVTDKSGFYAYNWFTNDYGGASGWPGPLPPPPPGPGVPPPGYAGYTGYPTFSIATVQRDQTVTILTFNLPPDDQFQVSMGLMGSRGLYGYPVTTFASGTGGSQSLTFSIPPQLSGVPQVAIRLQSVSGSRFYAYNWFYNN